MPNAQFIFSKYSRFILRIGTYEAPVPGWRREKFFSELWHFSLSYFHIFSCFTYKKLFYGKMTVTIVFCASEYPTWRGHMSKRHNLSSTSRLMEIISFSADRKIDNFSVRLLRIELRYGFNISFPMVIIGYEEMGQIWDGGYPDGMSWHGMTHILIEFSIIEPVSGAELYKNYSYYGSNP